MTITGAGGANRCAFTANPVSGAAVGGAGSGLDQITDFVSGTDKFFLSAAGGGALSVTGVYGAGSDVSQTDLSTAADQALVAASVVGGADAAPFSYQGSGFVVVDGDADGRFSFAADILIDIAATTSLTKNDLA